MAKRKPAKQAKSSSKPPEDNTEEGGAICDKTDDEGAGNDVTQINKAGSEGEEGNVTPAADGADGGPAVDLPEPYAREGETRAKCWERIRQEARTAGLPRGQGPGTAYEYATQAVEQLFQPEPVEPAPVEPEPTPEAPATTPPEPVEEGLSGLGDIPGDWPELPPNAALPAEVQWVQSNRLRVRQGDVVDLSRALSPAPSHAALAWLETSILYGAKWADLVARATAHAEDERESVRREKLAIEEVRGLLAEMIEAQGPVE